MSLVEWYRGGCYFKVVAVGRTVVVSLVVCRQGSVIVR